MNYDFGPTKNDPPVYPSDNLGEQRAASMWGQASAEPLPAKDTCDEKCARLEGAKDRAANAGYTALIQQLAAQNVAIEQIKNNELEFNDQSFFTREPRASPLKKN